ncbi:MAG: hypothetical protein ACR2KL_02700 [Nocardioidaceae bacterium]
MAAVCQMCTRAQPVCFRRVVELANERAVSVAAVIREAIDRGLPASNDRRRRQAAATLLSAQPLPVPPDPDDLAAELPVLRGGHR